MDELEFSLRVEHISWQRYIYYVFVLWTNDCGREMPF